MNNTRFLEYFKDSINVVKSTQLEDKGVLFEIDRGNKIINTLDPVITKACNLACPHCWGNNEKAEFMSVDNYKKILEFAKYLNIDTIQYTGGEPLLHPQLFDLAKESKKQKFYNRLRTNFTTRIFDEIFLIKILEYFDSIYISLDGSAEDNFYLRPSKMFMTLKHFDPVMAEKKFSLYARDNFNIIKTNLDNLMEIRKKYNYKNKIIIATVVQRYNLDKLDGLLDIINQYSDIRWDITQVTLDKNDPNNVTVAEFKKYVFRIAKLSKNVVKIKTTSCFRCLRVDKKYDIFLSNKINIKVGNLFSDNYDFINSKIQEKTVVNNKYSYYFYMPNNKLLHINNILE